MTTACNKWHSNDDETVTLHQVADTLNGAD